MKERRSLKRDNSNGRETLNNRVKDLLNKEKAKSYWSLNKNKNNSHQLFNSNCKNALICYTDLIRNEFNSGFLSNSHISLLASKKIKDKEKVPNINKKLHTALNKTLYNKYLSRKSDYDSNVVDNLIYNKNCHIVSIFKEYMILDYTDEFLRRWYTRLESKERIPKFANYYKNYLKFFCNPIFRSLKVNGIVQLYGDNKAELYYNCNYAKKKKTDKKSDSLQDDLKVIFHTTIKDNIEKNEMTQQSEDHVSTVITFYNNDEPESKVKHKLNKGKISDKDMTVQYYEAAADEYDDTQMEDYDCEILVQKSFLDRSVKRGNEESIANLLSEFETNRNEFSLKSGRKLSLNSNNTRLENLINKKSGGKIKDNNLVENKCESKGEQLANKVNMLSSQANFNTGSNNLSPLTAFLKKETKIKDAKEILKDTLKEIKRDPLKELKEVKSAIKELRDLRERNENKENNKDHKDDSTKTKKETNTRDSQMINMNPKQLHNLNNNIGFSNLNNNNLIQSYTNKDISKLKSTTIIKSNPPPHSIKARKIEEFKALKLSKPGNFNSNDNNKKFFSDEKAWNKRDSNSNNNKSNNFTATTQHMHSPSGSLHSINDIMKITLSVYMDKSNRLRSNSNLIGNAGINLGNTGINTLTTQTSNNNLPHHNNPTGNILNNRHSSPKSPSFKANTPTTIINKVDNYNNFNININNPVNINEEIQSILSRNIKETFNRKEYKTSSTDLNANLKVILEKNKTLSRNKNPSLYKMTIGAKSSEDDTFQGGTANNFNLQNNGNNYQGMQSNLPIKVYNSYGNHPCNNFLI
jgi:hypothetical protein